MSETEIVLHKRIKDLEVDLLFYKKIVEHYNDWFFIENSKGMIDISTPSMERITGFENDLFKKGEITLKDIVHNEDYDCFISKLRESLKGEYVSAFEFRIVKSDKEIAFCEATATPLFSEDNIINSYYAEIKDISKRKSKELNILNKLSSALLKQQNSQKQIIEQDNLLKNISSNLKGGAVFQVYTGAGPMIRFSYLSEGVENIYGYKAKEILRNSDLYLRLIHKEDILNEHNFFNTLGAEAGELCYYERIINAKTQEIKWTYIIASPSFFEDGMICWNGIVLDHTDQKRTEIESKQKQEKFRVFFEKSPDVIIMADAKGKIFDCNKSALKLFGCKSQEDLLDSGISNFFESIDPEMRILEKVNEWKGIRDLEIPIKTCHGEVRDVVLSIELIKTPEIQPFFICWLKDVTAYKKIHDLLVESEEKFSVAFRMSPYSIIITTAKDGKIVESNKTFLDTTGYSFKEVKGKTTKDLDFYVNRKDREEIQEMLVNNQKVYNKECNFKSKNGNIFVGLISSEKIFIKGQYCILSVISDITRLKEDELKILKLSTAVDQSPMAIVITDTKGYIEYVNPHFTKITGYSNKEVIGENPRILKTEYHNADFYKDMWMTILSGKIWKGEFLNKNKEGNLFWERSSIAPIFDEKHEIINFVAVKEDITEIKDAAEALRESEEKLRAIFNSANVGMAIVNTRGKFKMFNQAWLQILGYTEIEMHKLYHLEITHMDDRELTISNFVRINRKEIDKFRIEKRFIKKDSSFIWADTSVTTIKDSHDDIMFYTFVITDITAQKQALDAKMLQAMMDAEEKERVRIAQELHDGVGPLISSAKMHAQLLVSPTSKFEKAELAKNVEELLVEAQNTVRQISFSLSPHILQNFGLIEALKSFSERISNASGLNIIISANKIFQLQNSLETLLYRALCECVNNTLKHAEATQVDIVFNFSDKDVKIYYQDNGKGFDLERTLQNKSGLGLFNMMNRIKMINGKIDYKTEPGKGVVIFFEIKI